MIAVLIRSSIAFSLLICASCLFAEQPNDWIGKTVPQLVLADGKVYEQVTFAKLEADAVTITHQGGVARIDLASLRPEAQQAFGYDPEKAAAARKSFKAEQAELAAANAARIAEEQRMQAIADEAVAKGTTSRTDAEQTSSFKVGQVLEEEGGYLVYTYTPGGAPGAYASAMRALGGSGPSWIPPKTGNTPIFLRGDTGVATVDDDVIVVKYVETEETLSYESLSGKRTVKVYDLVKFVGMNSR